MAVNSASSTPPSGSDPSAGPFRFLGLDPDATASQIEAALARARQARTAPETRLTEAYATLLDPVRRLPSELSYPFDITPDRIDLFYAELPADACNISWSEASAGSSA